MPRASLKPSAKWEGNGPSDILGELSLERAPVILRKSGVCGPTLSAALPAESSCGIVPPLFWG